MSEFKKIMGIFVCGIALLFCGSRRICTSAHHVKRPDHFLSQSHRQ